MTKKLKTMANKLVLLLLQEYTWQGCTKAPCDTPSHPLSGFVNCSRMDIDSIAQSPGRLSTASSCCKRGRDPGTGACKLLVSNKWTWQPLWQNLVLLGCFFFFFGCGLLMRDQTVGACGPGRILQCHFQYVLCHCNGSELCFTVL